MHRCTTFPATKSRTQSFTIFIDRRFYLITKSICQSCVIIRLHYTGTNKQELLCLGTSDNFQNHSPLHLSSWASLIHRTACHSSHMARKFFVSQQMDVVKWHWSLEFDFEVKSYFSYTWTLQLLSVAQFSVAAYCHLQSIVSTCNNLLQQRVTTLRNRLVVNSTGSLSRLALEQACPS